MKLHSATFCASRFLAPTLKAPSTRCFHVRIARLKPTSSPSPVVASQRLPLWRRANLSSGQKRGLSEPALRNSKSESSKNVDDGITQEEISQYDKTVAQDKSKQIRTPWQREGADKPPVSRPRSAGAMTKGKLLTTPARLLKLVLPLTTRDQNTDRKDVEPLALLIHPSQPLSYLERLIQAELPLVRDGSRERVPQVYFNAADSMAEDDMDPKREELEDEDGNMSGVETYSGKGRESNASDEDVEFVRWSKSTEMGDFIRDAARGKEFGIEIEGAPREIRVGVPSFNDRTYYLRMRLRKKGNDIAEMAKLKAECDLAAHRSAQRIAYAGGGSLVAWSGIVAYLTFMTDLGWDVMEPVTYLVGMAGVVIGYAWFLMNRREASYQSAMNLTVTRRQHAAYDRRGFNLQKFEYLVDEANRLRREIMAVANEYDVDWDERSDAHDESVVKALKQQRDDGTRKGNENDEELQAREKD